jgi:glycosyltransferase involved in cell wall biosynthesis
VNAEELSGESIICISWLNWDWLPLVPHQMMTRLAARNRVLYVDPAVALTTFVAHPSQSSFLAGKIHRWARGLRKVSQNLHVLYPPPLLVTPGHLALNDACNRLFLAWIIRRAAARLGLHRPILWLYDPYVIEPQGQFQEKLVCYDCNDDTSSFATLDYKRRNMQRLDERLARRADLVLVTSRALLRAKQPLNANTHCLPSGVDFELFNRAVVADIPVPLDLADITSPVIGYVGALTNYRIEWVWIEQLALRMPDATIVLIGPAVEPPPSSVTRLPNVRLLGTRQPAELPAYLKRFDVGIIPYKGEAFLKGCQPTKTFEYLAAGLGVVSAPIPELEPYGEVVRIAANAEEFVAQTRAMLSLAREPRFRARCVDIARDKTWNARVSAASQLVAATLERKLSSGSTPMPQPEYHKTLS